MGPRQSEPPPNADLTNDTDLAHNNHTITRIVRNTRSALPATTRGGGPAPTYIPPTTATRGCLF